MDIGVGHTVQAFIFIENDTGCHIFHLLCLFHEWNLLVLQLQKLDGAGRKIVSNFKA